jgi:hypothetical protein
MSGRLCRVEHHLLMVAAQKYAFRRPAEFDQSVHNAF